MAVDEETDIYHKTRITLHNKNTMGIQGEVGECLRRIEGEANQGLCQRRDLQQRMDIVVVMIKEGAVKVEAIQIAAKPHRVEEVGDLYN